DLDRESGCIRDRAHAYSQDGGLAVLYGNLAPNGCIVKPAGVDDSILTFTGRARVYESQETAAEGILGGEVVAADVVLIRCAAATAGPGMQAMPDPAASLESLGRGKCAALLTDGRFSGGWSGLVIGHAGAEAAEGGNIALVEDGDAI